MLEAGLTSASEMPARRRMTRTQAEWGAIRPAGSPVADAPIARVKTSEHIERLTRNTFVEASKIFVKHNDRIATPLPSRTVAGFWRRAVVAGHFRLCQKARTRSTSRGDGLRRPRASSDRPLHHRIERDRDAGSDRLRHAPGRWNHPVGGLPGRTGSSAGAVALSHRRRARTKTRSTRRSPFWRATARRGWPPRRTRSGTKISWRPRSSRRKKPRCSSRRPPPRSPRFSRIVPRSSRRDSTSTTPSSGRRSPGRTGNVLVKRGNLVRSGAATPLVVINQVRPIYVRFSIPSSELPLVQQYGAAGGLPVAAVPSGVAPATPSIDSLAAAAMNPIGDPPGQDGGGFAGNGGNSGGKAGGRGRHGGPGGTNGGSGPTGRSAQRPTVAAPRDGGAARVRRALSRRATPRRRAARCRAARRSASA